MRFSAERSSTTHSRRIGRAVRDVGERAVSGTFEDDPGPQLHRNRVALQLGQLGQLRGEQCRPGDLCQEWTCSKISNLSSIG